jgi:hypothetical protein
MQPLIGPIDSWFNIYSMPGAIFIQALAYVPTSVLMLSPAVRALDPSLEEAALVAGAGRWQILWRRIQPPRVAPEETRLSSADLFRFGRQRFPAQSRTGRQFLIGVVPPRTIQLAGLQPPRHFVQRLVDRVQHLSRCHLHGVNSSILDQLCPS